jgi:ankyrin repeat protein
MGAKSKDLFAAIDVGDAESVAAALAAEPDLATVRDADLVSAPLYALYRGHRRIAEQLAAALPALDLFEAAALSRPDRVRDLLGSDASLARAFTPDGFTALHYPGFFGGDAAAEVSVLLLEAGADVDARSRNHFDVLPLHSACAGNQDEVVAVLLAAGADPNARQTGGYAPLHGAAQNGAAVTAERLLAAGADPTARTDDGRTPADLAAAAGHDELAARLAQAPGVSDPAGP